MRNFDRGAGLLVLLTQLPACYAWRSEQVAPQLTIATTEPDRVRITEPGGATVIVLRPTVGGDTLRGRSESGGYPVSIPLAEVLKLVTRRSNGPSSALIVARIGVGVAGIAVSCGISGC